MKKTEKVLTKILWVSVIILLIFSYFKPNNLDAEIFQKFESFDSYERTSSNTDVYRVSKQGAEIGYMAFGEAYGYQSNIMVGVVISDSGSILETQILKQNETPSFIQKIYNAGFLERQFKSKSIEEGFDVKTNISAVSGATISSRAITKCITEASIKIAEKYLDKTVPNRIEFHFGMMEAVLTGMILLAALSYKFNDKKLRYLTMSYSILLLGFKYKKFIAYSWIVSLVLGKAPAFSENIGWYILIVGTFVFILLTGKNIYCSYICPFGALQEAGKRLSGFDFFKVNPNLSNKLRKLPALLAYLAFVAAVLTEQIGVLSYEPFSLIFGRTGAGIQWALLPIVLIMSMFVMRFYCNYACPVGVVLRATTKARRYIANLMGKGKNKPQVDDEKDSKRLTA